MDELLGIGCEWPGCTAEAIRNPCNAETDRGRAHRDGGMHRLDDGPGRYFCRDHGNMVLSNNAAIITRQREQN